METQTQNTELSHFAECGYLRVPDALPPAFVQRVQDAVWSELERLAGFSREEPTTWRPEWVGVNKNQVDAIAGVELGAHLTEAVDRLLGRGRWRPPETLGGVLLTMPGGSPEPWSLPTDGWHVDNDPLRYRGQFDELMLFTFYSPVRPRGGGTLILSGSPQVLERYFAAQERKGVSELGQLIDGLPKWHPRLAELMTGKPRRGGMVAQWMERGVDVHGVPTRVVELAGEPGDAVLCHPAILHAGSRNCLAVPRTMRRTNIRRVR